MNKEVKPLYRKVNSKAIGCHHHTGPDAKNDRNTKKGMSKSMKKNDHRGLDYTPLYKFLLSKVGEDWTTIHSQAVARLDKEEPIYHLVAKDESHKKDYVRCGESSFYSGLYIDEENKLQKVNPDLKNEDLYPSCWCCTHTLNGTKFQKTYEDFSKKQSREANLKPL